jgi:hypothetical protein
MRASEQPALAARLLVSLTLAACIGNSASQGMIVATKIEHFLDRMFIIEGWNHAPDGRPCEALKTRDLRAQKTG